MPFCRTLRNLSARGSATRDRDRKRLSSLRLRIGDDQALRQKSRLLRGQSGASPTGAGDQSGPLQPSRVRGAATSKSAWAVPCDGTTKRWEPSRQGRGTRSPAAGAPSSGGEVAVLIVTVCGPTRAPSWSGSTSRSRYRPSVSVRPTEPAAGRMVESGSCTGWKVTVAPDSGWPSSVTRPETGTMWLSPQPQASSSGQARRVRRAARATRMAQWVTAVARARRRRSSPHRRAGAYRRSD
jgi:hypothetical protein